MSSRFASLITITDLMHKVDQKLNIITGVFYWDHLSARNLLNTNEIQILFV